MTAQSNRLLTQVSNKSSNKPADKSADKLPQWHTLTVDRIYELLETSKSGLTQQSVAARLSRWGRNELVSPKRSVWGLIASQLNSVLVYILLAACGVSIGLPLIEALSGSGSGFESIGISDFFDAGVILMILVMNTGLGVAQEFKTMRAIEKLQSYFTLSVSVIRDGNVQVVPAPDLVPGDIIQLTAGNKVPADCRLIEGRDIRVNQSMLTGESDLVLKSPAVLSGDVSVPDRANSVYSGTFVCVGSGLAVVVATGSRTEMGTIADLVSGTRPPLSPLQLRLQRLSRQIGLVVGLICLGILLVGLWQDYAWSMLLIMGLSLAVSAVPEGLPAIITLTMALGVKRLIGQNVLVRRLDAIETLGNVSVICSDKTGTITENKMTVSDQWVHPSVPDQTLLLRIAAACNEAALPHNGDPTELALLQAAQDQSIQRLAIESVLVPFSSESKYLKTRHFKTAYSDSGSDSGSDFGSGSECIYIKGAPEVVIAMLDVEASVKASFTEAANRLMAQGRRVLAFAEERGGHIQGVGIIGLEDPIREGVKTAVQTAGSAGIRTIMITGDSAVTAGSIAKTIGLSGNVVCGDQLSRCSESQWRDLIEKTDCFARILPAQKLAILTHLKQAGHVVAMTGDGVNDAPALHGAHVGIAMGKNGSDIAKESASIVLTDDHFSTIVAAISEGRTLYYNIQRSVLYLLRANFDEVLLMTAAIGLGFPLPLLPLHILWINLVTDSVPALALTQEPADPAVMQQPPRPINESILRGKWPLLWMSTLVSFLFSGGLFVTLLNCGMPLDDTRSILLTFAVMFEMGMAVSSRCDESLFSRSFWRYRRPLNFWLIGAIGLSGMCQILVLYTPIGMLLSLTPIGWTDWGMIASLCLGGFFILEIGKMFNISLKR